MTMGIQQKNQEVIAELLGAQSLAQRTKAQILDAYLKVAVSEGSTELSLTRLADEAGISKQLLRYHMPDLDVAARELFKITAQTGARFTQARLEQAKTWNAKMDSWVEATFDWVLCYPDFAKFLLFMYHRASVDSHVKDIHAKIVKTGRQRLRGVLASSPQKKIAKNADFYARMLHQQMTATLIEMLSLDDFKNHARYRKEFFQSMAHLLAI